MLTFTEPGKGRTDMEQCARKAAHFIAQQQKLDEERESVIAYGMLAFFQMLLILLYAVIWGLLTRTLWESLIIYFVVGIFRKFTGGAHAHSMEGCIFVSITTMSVMAALSHYVIAPRVSSSLMVLFTLFTFSLVFFVVWKKAPVDSPNKPIRKPEKIKRLRRGSFILLTLFGIISIFLTILTFFINSSVLLSMDCALMLALIWQGFTLTKLANLLFS